MASSLQRRHPELIPVFRFATVEDGLLRGAHPTPNNFNFLRCLQLKTMVSVTPEPPDKTLCQFLNEQGIDMVHFEVARFKENVTLTHNIVVDVLHVLIDVDRLPILLHCLDGANVTGMIIMCLRKLQQWSPAHSQVEFSRFIRGGAITPEESQFFESFRSEVTIPAVVPRWLWRMNISRKHPLKLKFLSSSSNNNNNNGSSSGGGNGDEDQLSTSSRIDSERERHRSTTNVSESVFASSSISTSFASPDPRPPRVPHNFSDPVASSKQHSWALRALSLERVDP